MLRPAGCRRDVVSRGVALAAAFASLRCPQGRRRRRRPTERSTSWLAAPPRDRTWRNRSGRIGADRAAWTSTGLRLPATIGDVAVSIPAEGAPPLTATIGEGRIKLAWSGLSGLAGGIGPHHRGRRPRRDVLVEPRVDRRLRAEGARKAGGPVAVQIDRLIVEDAIAEYVDGHQHVGWTHARWIFAATGRPRASFSSARFGPTLRSRRRSSIARGRPRARRIAARRRPARDLRSDGDRTGRRRGADRQRHVERGRVLHRAGTPGRGPRRALFVPHRPHRPFGPGRRTRPDRVHRRRADPRRDAGVNDGLSGRADHDGDGRRDLTVRPGHLEVDNIDARAYKGAVDRDVGSHLRRAIGLDDRSLGEGRRPVAPDRSGGQGPSDRERGRRDVQDRGDPGDSPRRGPAAGRSSRCRPDGHHGGTDSGPRARALDVRFRTRSGQRRPAVAGGRLAAPVVRIRSLRKAHAIRLTLDGTTSDARATQRATLQALRRVRGRAQSIRGRAASREPEP